MKTLLMVVVFYLILFYLPKGFNALLKNDFYRKDLRILVDWKSGRIEKTIKRNKDIVNEAMEKRFVKRGSNHLIMPVSAEDGYFVLYSVDYSGGVHIYRR